MSTYDDDLDQPESPEKVDPDEAEDTGFYGTGSMGSVIYEEDEESVDEAGDAMTRAPVDED